MYEFNVMKGTSWTAVVFYEKDLAGKDQVSGKTKILLWMLKTN